MGAYYDEIEIEDMVWDPEKCVYHYPCPCGDRFEISRRQLADCEDIATCPSCSLIIRVIFDPLDFEDEPSDDEASDLEAVDDSDAESDDDAFEDAMEHLSISNESPATVTVPA
ncbi:Diphthamide biosynthesis protein 3 [Pleurotus pulmonarius]|nr:Diphthamide biosynthesis protein 3 [Pleurotus pulmonarius]